MIDNLARKGIMLSAAIHVGNIANSYVLRIGQCLVDTLEQAASHPTITTGNYKLAHVFCKKNSLR